MKMNFVFLLLAGMLLTGCSQNTQSNLGANSSTENVAPEATQNEEKEETEKEGTEETEEDTVVLSFEASTIDGEPMTSQIFAQSKLTMVNVWATYCNPCLSEMPDLGEIAASYDTSDFQIIGIISDVAEGSGEEALANARDLVLQTGADYPHLLLNESLYTNLVGAVDSVPTTFFVNNEGEVLGYTIGAKSKADWEEIIHELLEQNES